MEQNCTFSNAAEEEKLNRLMKIIENMNLNTSGSNIISISKEELIKMRNDLKNKKENVLEDKKYKREKLINISSENQTGGLNGAEIIKQIEYSELILSNPNVFNLIINMELFYYECESVNDRGWGSGWRCFQTLLSTAKNYIAKIIDCDSSSDINKRYKLYEKLNQFDLNFENLFLTYGDRDNLDKIFITKRLGFLNEKINNFTEEEIIKHTKANQEDTETESNINDELNEKKNKKKKLKEQLNTSDAMYVFLKEIGMLSFEELNKGNNNNNSDSEEDEDDNNKQTNEAYIEPSFNKLCEEKLLLEQNTLPFYISNKTYAPFETQYGWAEPFILDLICCDMGISGSLFLLNGYNPVVFTPRELFVKILSFTEFVEIVEENFSNKKRPLPVVIDDGTLSLCILGLKKVRNEKDEISYKFLIGDPHVNKNIDPKSALYTVEVNKIGKFLKENNSYAKMNGRRLRFDMMEFMIFIADDLYIS